jgi:hypothetical protein
MGIVFALGHTVEGTEMLVISKHRGETICHRVELAPAGRQPDYLLVKKHLPLGGVP